MSTPTPKELDASDEALLTAYKLKRVGVMSPDELHKVVRENSALHTAFLDSFKKAPTTGATLYLWVSPNGDFHSELYNSTPTDSTQLILDPSGARLGDAVDAVREGLNVPMLPRKIRTLLNRCTYTFSPKESHEAL